MKVRAIITGATGMVGEGVLHECLQHADVEAVLVVGRRSCGISHPKLKEVLVKDFFTLEPIEKDLTGYNACFFCLGVSSVGLKEDAYTHLSYDLTLNFANVVVKQNKDLTFCYVSGAGTDSSEKGKSMWARVKGKTENDLMKLSFKKAYLFRPGYMHPTPGLKNTLKMVKALSWLYPIVKVLTPNFVSTLAQVGLAMIHTVTKTYVKNILEVPDIKKLADG